VVLGIESLLSDLVYQWGEQHVSLHVEGQLLSFEDELVVFAVEFETDSQRFRCAERGQLGKFYVAIVLDLN